MFVGQTILSVAPSDARKIKVVIIDDSALVCSLMVRWLQAETEIEVVGVGHNGRDGVDLVKRHQPDVIVLDIEMPVLDGLSALPEILKAAPKSRVIIASSLTQRGGEITIRALSTGASDYLAKPDAAEPSGADNYRRELVQKVVMLGARARRTAGLRAQTAPLDRGGPGQSCDLTPGQAALPPTKVRPKAIFIGASTGGPEALGVIVAGLVGQIDVPVFIAQHLPPLFTKLLAEHLSKQTGAHVVEAEHGMLAQAGCFYLAPGNFHMAVTYCDDRLAIQLTSDAHENFCRPAVDPLFRSAAAQLGGSALAIVLTGMGYDGREGAKAMVSRGSMLIAQDEESSVVWGMPGAVVKAGLATATKPLGDIAPSIVSIMQGGFP